jgi:hypothetical protein
MLLVRKLYIHATKATTTTVTVYVVGLIASLSSIRFNALLSPEGQKC